MTDHQPGPAPAKRRWPMTQVKRAASFAGFMLALVAAAHYGGLALNALLPFDSQIVFYAVFGTTVAIWATYRLMPEPLVCRTGFLWGDPSPDEGWCWALGWVVLYFAFFIVGLIACWLFSLIRKTQER